MNPTGEASVTLWSLLKDTLEECIEEHGPIGLDEVKLVVRSIVRNILDCEEFYKECKEDVYNRMILDTLKIFYGREVSRLRFKLSAARQEAGKFRDQENRLKTLKEAHDKLKKELLQLTSGEHKERKELKKELQIRTKELLHNLLNGSPLYVNGSSIRLVKKVKRAQEQLSSKLRSSLEQFGGIENIYPLAERLTEDLLTWRPDGWVPFYSGEEEDGEADVPSLQQKGNGVEGGDKDLSLPDGKDRRGEASLPEV